MTDSNSNSNSNRVICKGYIPSRQMLFHTFSKLIKHCSFLFSRLAKLILLLPKVTATREHMKARKVILFQATSHTFPLILGIFFLWKPGQKSVIFTLFCIVLNVAWDNLMTDKIFFVFGFVLVPFLKTTSLWPSAIYQNWTGLTFSVESLHVRFESLSHLFPS